MLEWILVDHAPLYPQQCILCDSQKGPHLDTHRELSINGTGWRIYVCQECARRAARGFGFTKGKRMDQLMKTNELIAQREREIQKASVDLAEANHYLEDTTRLAEERARTIEDQKAYIARLEAQITQAAKESLAAVIR